MGWLPGPNGGTGESPDRGPGTPEGGADDAPSPSRDPRLAEFASAGGQAPPSPSGRTALLADELSGPERRCPGATDDELIGLLQAWSKLESWAAAAKLGVIREMMRRDGLPSPGSDHGDLPETWSPSLRYELAAALACSTQSAETTAWLAWEQQARLPGIGELLSDGTLTQAKARAVTETFKYLMDADAAAAEALIADQLAGKTYPQVQRLAEQAALTVDPDLAARRREETQRKDARVSLFREQAGTAALSGRDLPPDEALAAMASVSARAQQYVDSEAFGDTRMDVLRAFAYLDLLNGVPPEARIARAEERDEAADAAEALAWAETRAARTAAARPAGAAGTDGTAYGTEPPPATATATEAETAAEAEAAAEAAAAADGDPDPSSITPSPPSPRAADLIVPLATLLGAAERPGEIHGFGQLDPALARALAAAAAVSPHTRICVTVTSPEGYAIAHGCARLERRSGQRTPAPLAALPTRLNLTIPATVLPSLPGTVGGPWALTPRGSPRAPGPPDSWTLATPGGRRFTVRLDPVPVFDCDHSHETEGYHPTEKLRHLVQVRDGTCTFPSCNRHARESDFEHAKPYDQGGKTCTCNAGARSRACHRVKQSKGWTVTQPRPGWHEWTTPSGRVYTQEPKRYPA
jgi:hypothetical protein